MIFIFHFKVSLHQLKNYFHHLYRDLKGVAGFPGGSAVKNLPANAGDTGSIPGWGRSPGEGNGYPLQYYCLENL